jgi:hypothetical protein
MDILFGILSILAAAFAFCVCIAIAGTIVAIFNLDK